jgi:PAS domain S-box-containing protein
VVDGGQGDARSAARLGPREDAWLLDAATEERFDRLARLACLALDVPIAFVTLDSSVDERRHAGAHFVASVPIADPAGRVLGNLCVADHRVRDISARERELLDELVALAADAICSPDRTEAARRVAGELERSEARFRALSETAPVGIVQTTSTMRCVYVNRAWSVMTGIPELEAIAQPWTAGIHPDDLESFERAWAEATALDRELAMEFRMLSRDGRVTFVVGHAITVIGPDGDVEGRLLTVQDVSVLQQTRTTLAEAEDLYHRVVESMTEGVVVQDRSGEILTANGASERILGLTLEQMSQRTVMDARWRAVRSDGSAFPAAEHPAMVALATGAPSVGVLVGVERPDGVVRWLRVNSMPLVRPDESEPWGVASTFSDVTESLALARMKDEFVSTVSHELRTPLTSIRGALGLLVANADGLQPPARRMLEIAESNSRRLVRLIDDILDIERMESGRAPLNAHEVDLGDLVRQAVETMDAMADAAGVSLRSVAPPTVAVVDPDRVLQVITNLLSNAVKFSPTGATVLVELGVDGGAATVRVVDEGRGVPAERQAAIFERFEQVDSSDARERGGTGLGLAICKSIVQQHGGAIGVRSEPGRGSTFWFTLPLVEPAVPVATPPQPATGAGADERDAAPPPRRVLVVEDDDDLARVLSGLLAARSIDADVVATLEDARRALASPDGEVFDLVLLDLLLPDGDGLSLVDVVRRSNPSVPIVAYSALDPGGHEHADLTEYHVKGRTDPTRFIDRIAALATGRSVPEVR